MKLLKPLLGDFDVFRDAVGENEFSEFAIPKLTVKSGEIFDTKTHILSSIVLKFSLKVTEAELSVSSKDLIGISAILSSSWTIFSPFKMTSSFKLYLSSNSSKAI